MKTWFDLGRLGALFTAIAWLTACGGDEADESVHTPAPTAVGSTLGDQTFAVPVTFTFAYDDAALGGTEATVLTGGAARAI